MVVASCWHAPREVTAHVLDFFVDAPGHGLPAGELAPHFSPVTIDFSGALQVFHAGYGSVAVPGVLSGYLAAHRALGRLPLSAIVGPASALARAGAELSATQATVLSLLRDILSLTPDAAELFLSNGRPPVRGERLHNHTYADFLDRLGSCDPTGWHEYPRRRRSSTACAPMTDC